MDERRPIPPPPSPFAGVRDDDRGFLYGDGVFDTMLAVDGALVAPERHLDRLAAGAAALGIAFDRAEAEAKALAAARARAGAAAVRVTVTRGPGAGLSPRGAGPATVVARAGPVPWTQGDRARGVAVATASARRVPAACLDPSLKTLNYLPNVLARREAEAKGAREALLLALDGQVVETAAGNVFAVCDGVLVTPPLDAGCFPGFARADVLEVARGAGVAVAERSLFPGDFACASEAFLTSSLAGVLPVVQVDGRPVAAGVPGPVTRRLQTLYGDLLKRRLPAVKGT